MPRYKQITSRAEVPQAILKRLDCLVLDAQYKHSHISFSTYKNRIVAVGRNSYSKTHPKMEELSQRVGATKKRAKIHSEVACLVKSRQKIDSIWIFRIGKSGQWLNSCPCPSCTLCIKEAGLQNVYYS